ncbi:Glycosyl transferase 2 family protein [Acanthocheilonema viteae]
MSISPVLISAIVPVKDGGAYLSRCLDSLLEQVVCSKFVIELSLFDDGSSDNTSSIIKLYKSKFLEKGINVIIGSSEHSKGVGFAKNSCVRQCSGSVLIFCDADDISAKHRFISLYNVLHNALRPDLTLVGSRFERIPSESTSRYTQWANSLNNKQIYNQVFTSYGPSMIAPTWCMSKKLYDKIGGFHEREPVGYPEDLRFFYDALKIGADFVKIEESLVTYRYHPKCTSLYVTEKMIWKMRIAMFEELVLSKWKKFMIWGAGKIGKKFYRSLSNENRLKVTAFCDIDVKKLYCGRYEYFVPGQRRVLATVPIIPLNEVVAPIAICLRMDFLDCNEVRRILKTREMVEGKDYFYLW